jgi:hypothetical protein
MWYFIALLWVLSARAATAQEITGTVHDATTSRPVSGAVLILSTGAGTTIARTLSDREGRFAFATRGDGVRLRALHIGFHPGEVALPATETTAIDVALAPLGSMLDTVQVVATNRCGTSGSAARAAALLEQAREGVLATEVAAEARPADMVRLAYVREFDRDGNATTQSVRRVKNRSIESFRAVYTAQQFVQFGFQQDSAGYLVFFAPDARTIVDPGFAAGYCFHVAHDRSRPLEVGLAFTPAAHPAGLVQIEGTLWADTAKRELRDIDFKYVGLDTQLNRIAPGGHTEFRAMPNGVVLVDAWSLRLPALRQDTISGRYVVTHIVESLGPEETGGRVVSAKWADYTWSAPMGTLDATLRDSAGVPLRGAFARLDDTDYRGRTDSTGALRIANLLPGPYSLSVVESAFADLSLHVSPVMRFEAVADSITRRSVIVPQPLRPAVSAFCPDGLKQGQSSVVIGRFYDADSSSVVAGGGVTASWPITSGGYTPPGSADSLRVHATTTNDGLFSFCGLPAGTAVTISAESGTKRTRSATILMPNTRTLIRRE